MVSRKNLDIEVSTNLPPILYPAKVLIDSAKQNQSTLNIEIYKERYAAADLLAIFFWEMQPPPLGDRHLGTVANDDRSGLSLEELAELKNGKMNSFKLNYFAPATTDNPDMFNISIGVFSPADMQNIEQILAD